MTQRRLVILDRDGVVNEDTPAHVRSPDEWIPLPGSLEAIGRLTAAGEQVAVATNQSGIARGHFDQAMLEAIHARMRDAVHAVGGEIACIVFCPHGPGDGCACQKPAPGLLLEIGARLGTSLEGVPFVGDAARDLDAARAAGCAPVLVRTGKGRSTEAALVDEDVAVFDDLASFVDHRLAGQLGDACP
jgi:D-glycero-D-manno-heptose 1,7-bisphosphate phosphatase